MHGYQQTSSSWSNTAKIKIVRLVTNCPPQSCTALLCYNSLVFFLHFFAASSTQGGINIGTMLGVVVPLVVVIIIMGVVIIIMGVVIGILVARNRCNKLAAAQHAV